jgi:hypothetical protein
MNFALLQFSQSSQSIETYDFVEVSIQADPKSVQNPFTDVSVTAILERSGNLPLIVHGFCDSDDGSVYRVRFLADKPGDYHFTVTWQHGEETRCHSGGFIAHPSNRKGIVRVDPEYPFHFIWEGTGVHYFYNGTTCYMLMGLTHEKEIEGVIDRLGSYAINRMRVLISGRYPDEMCNEPIYASDDFSMTLNPWHASDPFSVDAPGFDLTRFNVDYWQKIDRMLRYARERDMIVSLIFLVDLWQPACDPFRENRMGEDEKRYFRYAAARFGAFSNVMWDLCNEHRNLFPQAITWANFMGDYLKACDPWKHLTSIHGHEEFFYRNTSWADFAMYQNWDAAGGYPFMLNNRLLQEASGKIMPQVNEEYGYESIYPELPLGVYGKHHEADTRTQIAFEIAMAGCYQTTGERADIPGCGGWINGRGNEQMRMLESFKAMTGLMTSFEWWKMMPYPELVSNQSLCLAEPGRQYLISLRYDWVRKASVLVEPGQYHAEWRDPFSQRRIEIGIVEGPVCSFTDTPPGGPWAVTLRRID